MKWLVLGLVGVVVVGAAAAVGHAVGVLRLPALRQVLHRQAPTPKPVSVDIPSITTNLGGGDGSHFAQVTLTVSLANAQAAKEFNAKLPAIEDAVIADIRQRSATELDANGGMSGLRQAVQASMTQLLGSGNAVQAVYFTQFIVQ